MARFPSMPTPTGLEDVLKKYPAGLFPLLELHDAILREDSPLSLAERELIAAFVSGINGCHFCYGSHRAIAEAYGVDFGLFDSLMEDLESAPVEAKWKPLLEYIRVLTLTPSAATDAAAQAVFDAGWSEQALHDAIRVCAMFNFMNRLVEGMGVTMDENLLAKRREYFSNLSPAELKDRTYVAFGRGLMEG